MPNQDFTNQQEMERIFEHLLGVSVADETELLWFERRHGLVDHGLDYERSSGAPSHGRGPTTTRPGDPASDGADSEHPTPVLESPGHGPDEHSGAYGEPRNHRAGTGPFDRSGRDPGGYVDISPERQNLEAPRLTVLLRVVEKGRVGWHRCEGTDLHDLENGLRHALAVAKVQPVAESQPVLCRDTAEPNQGLTLHDPEIAALDLDEARRRLADWCGDSAVGRFHWSETRVAIWNSHDLRRSARSTEASLTVSVIPAAAADWALATDEKNPTGAAPLVKTAIDNHTWTGAGYAAGSARRLVELAPQAIVERARQRATSAYPVSMPAMPIPVVLGPEAVVELLNVLNTFAFAGRAYVDGDSFLRKHRNVQVFDSAFHLRDDGLRMPGLPFPFDLEGTLKTPVDLIVKGQPSTPALTRSQGAHAGLAPTGQSVGGLDAFFGNLFLLPGGLAAADLANTAEGGLYLGWLDPPECFDPQRLEIRTRVRGVRRIENGNLGPPVRDLIWQTSLLGALARLHGIGRDPVVRAMPSTPMGGISAPALVLDQASGFTPVEG